MANVYSTQILAFSADESPPAFEVPSGYVLVVRDVDLTSGGGAMINYKVGIAAGATFWWGQFTVESVPQSASWRGRQVLMPGQAFYVAADGAIDGVASGYLLALP